MGSTPLTPVKEALAEDLNFQRVQFAGLEIAGPKGAPLYHELIGMTALNRFLGADLAALFDEHFGRHSRSKGPGGRSRSSLHGGPDGPYIRFAEAVMHEFGQKVSRETINKAIKAVRLRALEADMGKSRKK